MLARTLGLCLLFLSAFFGLARAAGLSSFHISGPDAGDHLTTLKRDGRWWARVDDRIYHAPSAPGDWPYNYFYALGSHTALSEEMAARRVGGEGRVHIFDLPRGPSMLQVKSSGGRRSSVSRLVQLKHGTILNNSFDEYTTRSAYVNPLDKTAQSIELAGGESISGEQVMKYLTELVNVTTTRSYDNAVGTDRALTYLKAKFEDMGLTVCIHSFVNPIQGGTLKNLIAYKEGGTAPASTVTVGAHYDSRPFTGLAPGAEDNGSGVAVLLAIAAALMQTGVVPEKSVYFIAFGGEEIGLVGSRKFVNELRFGGEGLPAECRAGSHSSLLEMQSPSNLRKRRSGSDEHCALVLDEVGWASPAYSSLTVNLEASDYLSAALMQHLSSANDLHNAGKLAMVHNGEPFGSDHMSFLDLDIPAVLSINADDEAYPHYHMSTDTLENVNGTYAAMIAKMNFGALLRMAGVHDQR